MSDKTLYERLGGYDAISAVAGDLLPRLKADSQLARFWSHRGEVASPEKSSSSSTSSAQVQEAPCTTRGGT
jgi:hypothetical protein